MTMFPSNLPLFPECPLVDNMFAPEILAAGVSGLAIISGIVTVTLENGRCDHSRRQPTLERVMVGRIAMPIPPIGVRPARR